MPLKRVNSRLAEKLTMKPTSMMYSQRSDEEPEERLVTQYWHSKTMIRQMM